MNNKKTNPGARETGAHQNHHLNSSEIKEFIKRIAQASLQDAERVASTLLPDGKRKGIRWHALNPRRQDQHSGNFSIDLKTGQWADFASGDKGGDLVALCSFVRQQKNQLEAANDVADILGMQKFSRNDCNSVIKAGNTPPASLPEITVAKAPPVIWKVITPVPMRALKAAPKTHPKFGTPDTIYRYDTADGELCCFIYRWEAQGQRSRKEFCPVTYGHDSDKPAASAEWRFKGLQEQKPLYKLHKIATNPSATIVVCEGEKAADAASQLLPESEFVCTSWMHGVNSVDKTDWSILKGRKVWLWPDNDDAGMAAMKSVADILRDQTANVNTLDLKYLTQDFGQRVRHATLPKKYDAADALSDGWSPEAALNLLQAVERTAPYKVGEQFRVTADSVIFTPSPESGKSAMRICDRLEIRAMTHDGDGNGWGKLLKWNDASGRVHEWCMPMHHLKGNGEELRGILLDKGFDIETNTAARTQFMNYVRACKPGQIVRSVSATGWHLIENESLVFVTPSECIGKNNEPAQIIYQGPLSDSLMCTKGSLNDYKLNVLSLCEGNSRLVLSVAIALAAPLLYIIEEENGGFHLCGNSSNGKTTTLMLGCSVYGNPSRYKKTWRATDNAMESVAASYSDLALFIDELAQVQPEKAGEIAYLLGNGSAKAREKHSGGLRPIASWRLLFMSSGEITLDTHMRTTGKTSTAGQEGRMINIPADAGKKLGVFENLHGHADGAALATALKERYSKTYGVLGRQWILKLASQPDDVKKRIQELSELFISSLTLDRDASRQVGRAANRFALLAAAAQLATEWELTGWSTDTAFGAIKQCFTSWLNNRGTKDDLEVTRLLQQVRLFFQQHGDSRFTRTRQATDGTYDRDERDRTKTINRAGYVCAKGEFKVLRDVYRQELIKGFDSRFATRVLIEAGYLLKGTDHATTVCHDPDFGGSIRVYAFSRKVLGG